MFENILHQKRTVDVLKHDIQSGTLPNSILITGGIHSGKLTTALELVRSLSCSQASAPWSCSCSSCRQHRLLDSPYLLLTGSRYFADEIRAGAHMLRNQDTLPLRFLFYRNVKKLIRRFDPVLWQDDASRLNKAEKLIEKLEDLAAPVHPESGGPEGRAEIPDPDTLDSLVEEIGKILPADGVNVDMIRRATYWAHTADTSRIKAVIIENAHEMNDAARNAFLKTLEEPPSSVFFILLSDRPGALIPTIRSRLRQYSLAPRGKNEYRDIISRIYRAGHPEDYSSLQSFFIDCGKGGLEARKHQVQLMYTILDADPAAAIRARDELAESLGSDRGELRRLVILCLDELKEAGVHTSRVHALQRKLEEIHFSSEIYNIPVASALEHGYI